MARRLLKIRLSPSILPAELAAQGGKAIHLCPPYSCQAGLANAAGEGKERLRGESQAVHASGAVVSGNAVIASAGSECVLWMLLKAVMASSGSQCLSG